MGETRVSLYLSIADAEFILDTILRAWADMDNSEDMAMMSRAVYKIQDAVERARQYAAESCGCGDPSKGETGCLKHSGI